MIDLKVQKTFDLGVSVKVFNIKWTLHANLLALFLNDGFGSIPSFYIFASKMQIRRKIIQTYENGKILFFRI